MALFDLKAVLDPLAAEVREFGDTLVELLVGITAEQRKTNELLDKLIPKDVRPPTAVDAAAKKKETTR